MTRASAMVIHLTSSILVLLFSATLSNTREAPEWTYFQGHRPQLFQRLWGMERKLRAGANFPTLNSKPLAMCQVEDGECNPWHTSCCLGLECINYSQGFCMGQMDKCTCQISRQRTFFKGELPWYKRSQALAGLEDKRKK